MAPTVAPHMDNLIKLVNRLQDAFAAVNVSNPIDLPQITSSGKSSVLENIVGRDFLPRGQGIVTRRPLVLQLINRPSAVVSSPSGRRASQTQEEEQVAVRQQPAVNSKAEGEEWGEFLHRPGHKFFDFSEIRREIEAETDRKTGKGKGVSPDPINLRIYSPYVLTLTLVDLPGLTKVPVGDQPKDIERQIRDMILQYISKPNAIILAVTAANTDLANSDGLKLAQEVDPDGLRTIGVLTKIDLMDKGTDVREILQGQVIPLRLGYVPVVNRGQKDIESNKAIYEALEAERSFFEGHPAYSSKAAFCGTPYLAKKLNTILMHHIRNALPDIKNKINANLARFRQELATLGDQLDGPRSNLILQIITEFTADFRKTLEGQYEGIATTELNGGARIAFVFHEIFATAIGSMDPFDQIKESDIRTLLYNSSGPSPALFVTTQAFDVLIKQQIVRLEDPALKCVTMVYEELVRILSQLLQKPVFRRYPQLKERFYSSVVAFFRRGLDPTSGLVSQLVAAEACYINTAHPDFINGHRAIDMVNAKLQLNTNTSPTSTGNAAKLDAKGNKISSVPTSTAGGSQETVQSESGGIFGSFFSKKPVKKPGVLEPPPPVLKASGAMSERELVEIEVIKLLINSYFSIVKRTVVDLVPKYIMSKLVLFARDEMQKGLLAELYREDLVAELLQESSDTVNRRKECKRMIEALEKASEIVNTV